MNALRFAVDRMLGRLATWLRLIGQDATYGAHLGGRTLLRHARAEGRIVLTRDRSLLRRPSAVAVVFVRSDHFREQLEEIVQLFDLRSTARPFSRCVRCNVAVTPITKEEAAARVPAYVLATQERFVTCPRCRRIYWPATHHQHVVDELHRMGLVAGTAAGS